jgi:multidrug resistance protein, MATE family
MSGLRRTMAEMPAIMALVVPIVTGLAASTLLGVTDSLMLAPLGPIPLAAVGITNAVAVIAYAAIYGLLSALSVRIGAAYGAGAGRAIPGILRAGLVLGFLVGALGTILMLLVWPVLPRLGQPAEVLAVMFPYWMAIALMMIPFSVLTVFKSAFEAVERPWLGTAFAMLAVIINIPLNYALIWGIGPFPMLGLTGAGVATVVAETLALGAAWAYWLRAPSMRRLRLRRMLDWANLRATLREGAPLGLMYVAETAAMAMATLMIGVFGAVALAGNQVAMSVGGLLYMVPLGVAGAVAIRVAQVRGSGESGRLRAVTLAALSIALGWLVAAALLLGFGGAWVAARITDDAGVIAVAAAIFAIFALSQVMDGVQSTMTGALRGLSDAGFAAGTSLLAYWGLGLPLGWTLAHWAGMGPAGIWAGFVVALGLASIALVWRFLRQTR